MELSRSWMRRLYGASGVALLVPGTVIAAFLVLALAGGFGQLGSFRQVLAGPSLASRGPSGGGVSATSSRLAAAIAASTQRPGSGLTGTGAGVRDSAGRARVHARGEHPATRSGRGSTSAAAVHSGAPTGARHPVATTPTTSHASSPVTPAPSHAASTGTQTQPVTPTTTTPPRTLASAVGATAANVASGVSHTSDTVAAVVGKVGPPIGPIAASTVSSVGGTVSKILKGAAGAVTATAAVTTTARGL